MRKHHRCICSEWDLVFLKDSVNKNKGMCMIDKKNKCEEVKGKHILYTRLIS